MFTVLLSENFQLGSSHLDFTFETVQSPISFLELCPTCPHFFVYCYRQVIHGSQQQSSTVLSAMSSFSFDLIVTRLLDAWKLRIFLLQARAPLLPIRLAYVMRAPVRAQTPLRIFDFLPQVKY